LRADLERVIVEAGRVRRRDPDVEFETPPGPAAPLEYLLRRC